MRRRLMGALAGVLLLGGGLFGVAGIGAVAAGASTDATTGVYSGPSTLPEGSTVLTKDLTAQVTHDADSGPKGYWALDTLNENIEIAEIPSQAQNSGASSACIGTPCYYISVTDRGTAAFEAGDPSPGYGLVQGQGGTAKVTGGWGAYLSAADYALAKDVVLAGAAPSAVPGFGDLGGSFATDAVGAGTSSYAWLNTYFVPTSEAVTTTPKAAVLASLSWGFRYGLQDPPPNDPYTTWYDTGTGPDHGGQPGVAGDGVYNGYNDIYIPAPTAAGIQCTVAFDPANNPPVEGLVGSPVGSYTLSALNGAGSEAATNWQAKVVQGSLPAGVTLSDLAPASSTSAPVLSGTPEATGGVTYQVTATSTCPSSTLFGGEIYNLMNYAGYSFAGVGFSNPATPVVNVPSRVSAEGPFAVLSYLFGEGFAGSVTLDFQKGPATCRYEIPIPGVAVTPSVATIGTPTPGSPTLTCADTATYNFLVVQNGATGPAGPLGFTGPEGPQGPQGTPGFPGINGGQGSQGANGGQGSQGASGSTSNPKSTNPKIQTPKVTAVELHVRWSIRNHKGRALKLEASTVPSRRGVGVKSCWWIKPAGRHPYHLVGCGRYAIDHVYHLTRHEAIKSRGFVGGVVSHPIVLVG